jgi:hypothetical protein
MNKDEVIALAEKCKLAVLIHSQWTHEIKEFTVVDYVVEGDLGSLMQFADLVANTEREACAKVCDEMEEEAEGTECCKWPTPIDCAYVIRTRGQA